MQNNMPSASLETAEYSLNFSKAYEELDVKACIKLAPEDFLVKEILGFEFTDAGEHICLLIEKTQLNTKDLITHISRTFNINPRDIAYAGLKDKQAITQQWISIRVGLKKDLTISTLENEKIKILDARRNSRKIKRGSHAGNLFCIRLKNIEGSILKLEERISLIRSHGVPNYFGIQRFGRSNGNVEKALAFFQGKRKVNDKFLRGLYLSAARSWIFNQVLSQRVQSKNWDTYLEGDVMSLAGSASSFSTKKCEEVILQRLAEFDIHPSGPLWGKGNLPTVAIAKSLETDVASRWESLCTGLEQHGLKQERRALRLHAKAFSIKSEDQDSLLLEFSLEKGTYATSVLRELVTLKNE